MDGPFPPFRGSGAWMTPTRYWKVQNLKPISLFNCWSMAPRIAFPTSSLPHSNSEARSNCQCSPNSAHGIHAFRPSLMGSTFFMWVMGECVRLYLPSIPCIVWLPCPDNVNALSQSSPRSCVLFIDREERRDIKKNRRIFFFVLNWGKLQQT